MNVFNHSFTVNAPAAAVTAFHHDTRVLKQLTPLPIIAWIHEFEPLADGSEARFTLWFGPIPLRWHAVHSNVTANGFTDTQLNGPLQSWQHDHRFVAIGPTETRVEDSIVYEHDAGWRGVISRLLFNRLGLLYLFTARKFLTQRGVARLVSVDRPSQPV